jgi:hypothetical protein
MEAAVVWMTKRTALIVCGLGMIGSTALGQTEIELTIRADKREYASREPVKITVTLKNVSDHVVRIPGIRYLDFGREHMMYEVVTPAGGRSLRVSEIGRVSHTPADPGEPLAPGRSVTSFLYPNITGIISGEGQGSRQQVTFNDRGIYSMRVVYRAETWEATRWKPRGDELYSNAVEIRVRTPTTQERKILDAVWSRPLGLIFGDQVPAWRGEASLMRVIRMYRRNPMIRHAYLAIAMSLLVGLEEPRVARAMAILERLIQDYPDYRFEETRQHLGSAYYRLGRLDDATRIYQQTLDARPELLSNNSFISSALSATGNSYPDYMKRRRAGEEITHIDLTPDQ